MLNSQKPTAGFRLIMLSLIGMVALTGCRSEVADSPSNVQAAALNSEPVTKTAILAGGCFWCVEADFEKLPGVLDVVSGYSGGSTEEPTYENYAAGGHVEVVLVTYDPALVTYAGLVEWLIKHSDPTDADGSFRDRGKEYWPVVYYENEQEQQAALRVIQAVDKLEVYDQKLALEVAKREKFWPAETYHQDYHAKNNLKYRYYRYSSGRDAFIEEHWGEKAMTLELPGAIPEPDSAAIEPTALDTAFTSQPQTDTQLADDAIKLGSWANFKKPTDRELRAKLNSLQYRVTQQKGTEPAFQNTYWDNERPGIYVDVVSGEPLFSSADKYESGTGWPSFVKPIDPQFIVTKEDRGYFSTRTEVRSRFADSHVGHVFDDGPASRGGLRYCMNSAALRFVPEDKMQAEGYGKYLSTLK